MHSNKITTKMMKRGAILFTFFCLASILISIALFKLQILGYDKYQNDVLEQLTVETNVNPLRGNIYDRNGNVLASNKTVWVLYLIPKNIEKKF